MKIKSFTHQKRGPFRKNKTPLCGIESFSNSTFYGAIVSNTQYSTSGGLINSDTVFLKNNSMQTDMDIQTN